MFKFLKGLWSRKTKPETCYPLWSNDPSGREWMMERLSQDYPFVLDDVFSHDELIGWSDRFEAWQDAVLWSWKFNEPEPPVYITRLEDGRQYAWQDTKVENVGHVFYFKHLTDAVEFKLRFSK